jgi:SAM-dependent methyltransferase
MFRSLRRITFNLAYLLRPRWDTGIPAPELLRFIDGKEAGNFLDVGCGTGTNLLCLAQRNWRVTGVDFAPLAILKARHKLRNYARTLLVADVTQLARLELAGPYDLALDMGCFHSLTERGRLGYVRGMEKWVKPKATLMIYAFQPSEVSPVRGITRQAMSAYFRDQFELDNYEQGQGRPSAWYYFKHK